MKPKYRSWISSETLAFKLKCTISVNYTWNFKDLLQKKRMHSISLINIIFILLHIEMYCQYIGLNIIGYQNQLHLVLFTFIDVATRSVLIMHVAHIVFLLDSTALECRLLQGLVPPKAELRSGWQAYFFFQNVIPGSKSKGLGRSIKKNKSI